MNWGLFFLIRLLLRAIRSPKNKKSRSEQILEETRREEFRLKRKLTPGEIQKIEESVKKKIKEKRFSNVQKRIFASFAITALSIVIGVIAVILFK